MLHMLLLCTLALGVVQAPAPTASTVVGDVSGEWTGDVKAPVSYSLIPMYFKLQQKDAGVSGTAGPAAASQFPISDVKRTGKTLHFSVSDGGLTFTFDLVLNEGRLEGEVRSDDHQGNTWTAKASMKRIKDAQQ